MISTKLNLYSKTLSMNLDCRILLPDENIDNNKLKVLWLCHGDSGDENAWLYYSTVVRLVDEKNIAIVIVTACDSCFVDMSYGDKYGTYIGEELPSIIWSMFKRLSDKREDNYIAGLSNGGYGCFLIGLLHRHNFSAIGAFSAGDKADSKYEKTEYDCLPARIRMFGNWDINDTEYSMKYVARQVAKEKDDLPYIYHACGGKDPWLHMNLSVKEVMEELKVYDYVYDQMEEYGHEWDFWDVEIRKFLEIILNKCHKEDIIKEDIIKEDIIKKDIIKENILQEQCIGDSKPEQCIEDNNQEQHIDNRINHMLQRMTEGKLYYFVDWDKDGRAKALLDEFNNSPRSEAVTRTEKYLKPILGSMGSKCYIEPPFYCDYGFNIYLGHDFYANTGFIVLDQCPVHIGNYVYIGPRVSIFCATHPIDAIVRNTYLEGGKPVNIGDSVWIGGHTVINPGVSIGSNVVIGSGSVVTKDIPNGVIAAGNPCKVIREITEDDHKYWMSMKEEYEKDMNEIVELPVEDNSENPK